MLAVPRSRPATTGIGDRWAANAIAAAVLAILLEVTLRAMVYRAQPVASASDLALDDAIRSASIHRTAGAGLALQLLVLQNQLEQAAWAWQLGGWRWPIGLLELACLGVAATAWSNAVQPSWLVRRGTAPRPRPESGRRPA
jgi:hypothetical protein